MLLTLCFDASNAVSLEKILTVTAMATSTRYRSLVWLSVCMSSVTLMHPAKAIRRNEMPFGRDTCVVQSNTVLDMGRGDLEGQNPQFAGMPKIIFICIKYWKDCWK